MKKFTQEQARKIKFNWELNREVFDLWIDENTEPAPLLCPVCGEEMGVMEGDLASYAMCNNKGCSFELSRSYDNRKELEEALERYR